MSPHGEEQKDVQAELLGRLECPPVQQKAVVLTPSRGAYERQPIEVSLSRQCFSLSLLLSKINKHILGEDFFKTQKEKQALFCLSL